MTDAKTNAPLFNKAAWKTANNVLKLKEILAGNASDGFLLATADCKGRAHI
jgi:hypothetical protein